MNFTDLIYQHNLRSLSTPAIVKAYKTVIVDKKDKFIRQIWEAVENGTNADVTINGRIFNTAEIVSFLNGNVDTITAWNGEANEPIDNVDDQIQEVLEEFSVIENFLDSLAVQASSASDRVSYFINSINFEGISTDKAASLFSYYKDMLLNSANVNSALDNFMKDISQPPAQSGEEEPEIFNATGVNPFLLMLNNIDFPDLRNVNLFEVFTEIGDFINSIKSSVRIAAKTALNAGIQKFNTTFVDTVDFQLNANFDDLSCDQSCVQLTNHPNLAVDDPVESIDFYYTLAPILKTIEDDGGNSFNYAVPVIGATLYIVAYKKSTYVWDVTSFLKKHIYDRKYSTSILTRLIDGISQDVGASTLMSSLHETISSVSAQPSTHAGSIAEGYQFLDFRTTEKLIMLGILLLVYGNDATTCYNKLVEWYRVDGNGDYKAQYAFTINYGQSGVPDTVTNQVWYQEAQYADNFKVFAVGFDLITALCNVCPGSTTMNPSTSSESNPFIVFDVAEFMSGVLSIKSDEQLVAELKTVLSIIGATITAVTVAAVGIKLKISANKRYLNSLRAYKNVLANPNASASELLAAYRKSNRWSKLASKSIVNSSAGWYVSAPSAATMSTKSSVNILSSDIGDVNTGVRNLSSSLSTLESDVRTVQSSLDGANTTITNVANTVTENSSELANIKSKSDEISTEIANLQDDFSSNVAIINNNFSEVSSSNAAIKTDILEVSQTLNSASSSIGSLDQKVDQISTDLNQLTSTVDSEFDTVGNDVSELSSLVQSVSETTTAINNKVVENAASLDTISQTVASLSAELSDVEGKLSSDITAAVDVLQNDLNLVSQAITNTQNQVTSEATGIVSNIITALDLKIAVLDGAILLLKSLIK